MIEEIVNENGGQFYTSESYQIAEDFFKDRLTRLINKWELKNLLKNLHSSPKEVRPLPEIYHEPYSFNGNFVVDSTQSNPGYGMNNENVFEMVDAGYFQAYVGDGAALMPDTET